MMTGMACQRADELGVPYMDKPACIDCLKTREQPCGLPGNVVLSMWEADGEPDGLALSPTRILDPCLRKKYYEKNKEDYLKLINPRKKWDAWRGKMSHSFFEHLPPEPDVMYEMKEQRMTIDIETQYGVFPFTAKPDLIEILDETTTSVTIRIKDWKSAREIGHDMTYAKIDHQKQVNMYSYVFSKSWQYAHKKVIVDELQVFYFTMKNYRKFSSKYDLVDIGKLDRKTGEHELIPLEKIQIKPMEEVEQLIIERSEAVIAAKEIKHPRLEGDLKRICAWCPFYRQCWSEEE